MKNIKEDMIKIYKTYNLDWMNYIITDNDLTYHHIVKIEEGGKTTIDNGALLTQRAHNYLNTIEKTDIDIYNRINEILKEINNNKSEPTKIQRQKIDLLLFEFEVKNVDKIIKKKEKLGKNRTTVAHMRRINSQCATNIKKD